MQKGGERERNGRASVSRAATHIKAPEQPGATGNVDSRTMPFLLPTL